MSGWLAVHLSEKHGSDYKSGEPHGNYHSSMGFLRIKITPHAYVSSLFSSRSPGIHPMKDEVTLYPPPFLHPSDVLVYMHGPVSLPMARANADPVGGLGGRDMNS